MTYDNYVRTIPGVLKPGQVGYVFSYWHDLDGIDLSNGIKGVPHIETSEANHFYEITAQDISFATGRAMDITITGRGNNTTNSDEDFAITSAMFYDKNGKVVGCCYGSNEYPANSITPFSISGDLMSYDMKASSVAKVEVFIQGEGW